MFRSPFAAAASALLVTTAAQPVGAAAPRTAPALGVGTQVVDTQGHPVATVIKAGGDFYIVKTDRHEARLPKTSFTPYKGELLFAMTREQLNAQIEQSLAAAEAPITKGAPIMGSGGMLAGTVEAIDPAFITLRTIDGKRLRLPRSAVAPTGSGLTLGITAAELQRLAESGGN